MDMPRQSKKCGPMRTFLLQTVLERGSRMGHAGADNGIALPGITPNRAHFLTANTRIPASGARAGHRLRSAASIRCAALNQRLFGVTTPAMLTNGSQKARHAPAANL